LIHCDKSLGVILNGVECWVMRLLNQIPICGGLLPICQSPDVQVSINLIASQVTFLDQVL